MKRNVETRRMGEKSLAYSAQWTRRVSVRRLARAGRQSEVHLRNLGTHTSTGIGDREAHLYVPGAIGRLGFHLELGIGEAGVGESVAEREERLDPELVVAPVTNTEALAVVGDEAVSASILLRSGNRGVVIATRKSDRQLTRRGDVAENDVGQRVALLLTAVPALQHGRDLVEPRHQGRSTSSQHHNCARIGSNDDLDEQILLVGEGEARQVGVFVPVGSYDNDRHVRPGGQRCGLLHRRRYRVRRVLPAQAYLAANHSRSRNLPRKRGVLLRSIGCILD